MSLARPVFILALVFSGCGGGPDKEMKPDPVYGPLTIGGGPDDGAPGFVPLTEGQDVMLVPGAQGGFHVYLNVRVEEKSMGEDQTLYLDRKARRVDTNELVSQNRQLMMFTETSSSGAVFETVKPMLMFLCPAPLGIRVNDQPLLVRVQGLLDDQDDEPIAEGTTTLTPRCPDGEKHEFCLKICSGD